jgi:hypothetical protein
MEDPIMEAAGEYSEPENGVMMMEPESESEVKEYSDMAFDCGS